MEFSKVVLPAPLGPMMATISPRPIWRLTRLRAMSAPNRTLIPSTSSKGPPPAPGVTTSTSPRSRFRDAFDADVGPDRPGAAVLVGHPGLDLGVVALAVEGLDEGLVLARDVAAADLAGSGDLLVVRVQLLVQDQEPPDLRGLQQLVLLQTPVDPLHLVAKQLVHLGLLAQVGVARIGNPPELIPVPDRAEVDVQERRHEG